MIGETFVLIDTLRARLFGYARRGDLVVDAPADVLGPGLAAVRPPGVLVRFVVQGAEHVHPTELAEYLR